jgi:hypothetical protein
MKYKFAWVELTPVGDMPRFLGFRLHMFLVLFSGHLLQVCFAVLISCQESIWSFVQFGKARTGV